MIPLLVRFGRIGDMVLQAPLLHLLAARYGHPCRLLGAGAWSGELYAAHPDVADVWQLRARHRPLLASPEQWRLALRLRDHSGPVYVSEDAPNQVLRIRRLLHLAGIRNERCTYLADQPRRAEHWVDRLLQFGCDTPAFARGLARAARPGDYQSAPRLYVGDADRVDCRMWLQQRGLDGGRVVLLQPGNKRTTKWRLGRARDAKQWPEENWCALLRGIRREFADAQIVLCGAPAEQEMLRQITRASRCDVLIATHDLPLRRLMALMTFAHSMVAVDTGPAHMAAALGCPLVVLYGDESPRCWSRRSASGKPVIELGGAPHMRIMDIGVDDVLRAWRQVAAVATSARRVAAVG